MTPSYEFSDHIHPDDAGALVIEGVTCLELAAEFGTPLFAVSEAAVRSNYRRFDHAFRSKYHENDTQVMFAIKANNSLAIRRILSQEGAGGDCVGVGEVYATLMGGAEPSRVVVNGTNKSLDELRIAATVGLRVHLDHSDDAARLEEIAGLHGTTVDVGIRIRPEVPEYEELPSMFTPSTSIAEAFRQDKFGLFVDEAIDLIENLKRCEHLRLGAIHCHIGRHRATPEYLRPGVRGIVEFAQRLREATGFVADTLDLGGGFPSVHDPLGRGAEPAAPVEEFATVVVDALRHSLAVHSYPSPILELEPGRYLVEDAAVLLATVGTVKARPGVGRWINVDAAFNHLLPTYSEGTAHHVVVASHVFGAVEPCPAQLVGPTCYEDVLAANRSLPTVKRGDLVALLDVGAYCEVQANQFNGIPRPATVLVSGRNAYLTRERESVPDIFAHQLVPPHLLAT